jgi:methyl-accepting chemotaxis protein
MLQYLRVWQKLALLGVLFLIPFAIVTSTMVSSINSEKIDFAQLELMGTEYDAPLSTLLKDLQQHEGLAAAMMDTTSKNAEIEADIKKVDDVVLQLNHALDTPKLDTTKEWSDLRAVISDLIGKTASLSPSDNLTQHQKALDGIIKLINDVSDNSKLTLDPDPDSYYLMDVVMFQGPNLTDFLAQARSLGSSMVAAKTGTPDEFDNLVHLATLADFVQNEWSLADSLNRAMAGTVDKAVQPELEPQAQATADAVKQAMTTIRNLTTSRKLDESAVDYQADLTKNIDAVFAMENQTRETLNRLLDTRIAFWKGKIYSTLGWCALLLLGVLLIGFFIFRDITVPLKQVVAIANQIAKGDLTIETSASTRRDEVGSLSRAFNRMVITLKEMVKVAEEIAAGNLAVSIAPKSDHDVMGKALASMIEKLSQLVGQVQKSGIQVNTSVTEIAATSKQQQATASEIAATTTEISATSREITATSKELVKTMGQVSKGADQSASLAGNGQAGLSRMEETMKQVMEAASSINAKLVVLNEKAGNINQVVTTITKVADQTNLLSLNAAIEAEKAGEYGRGFAVVATEIRRLADQTAVATYDIEQMVKEIQSAVSAGVMGMDKFSEEVRRGIREVQLVGGQLTQIIQEVQSLAPRFEAVNEGMQAQATGAEQITEALSQLNEAAQQTVESLRQSNQVIDGLNQASVGLRSGVSRFKLES